MEPANRPCVYSDFSVNTGYQNISKRMSIQRIVTSLLIFAVICQFPLIGLAPKSAQLTILINLLCSVSVFTTVIYLSKQNTFLLARFLLVVTFAVFISLSSWLWEHNYHTHWFLLLGIVIVSYLFSSKEAIWLYACYLMFSLLFLVFEIHFAYQFEHINQSTIANASSLKSLSNAACMVFACIALALNIRNFMNSHWQSLNNHSSSLQNIIDRIFPTTFVLQHDQLNAQIDYCNNVSVLFIDMSCYSDYAITQSLDRHVALLHQAYTRFDQILSKHGIIRVKTNGDQYIAAIGIPCTEAEKSNGQFRQLSLHQQSLQLCYAAIAIHKSFAQICEKFVFNSHLKMGIASGDVTAGVIGKLRPSFDLWGEPMIIASRLEQLCSKNNILLCPKTYKLLQGSAIQAEFNGKRKLKGLKGLKRINIYRVLID